MSMQEEFMERLMATFRVEAEEHIRALLVGIEGLQANGKPEEFQAALEVVFREAHSLKGAARAVDLRPIEVVCQAMENVFAVAKKGLIRMDAAALEVLSLTLDRLGMLLNSPDSVDAGACADQLNRIAAGAPVVPALPVPAEPDLAPVSTADVVEPARVSSPASPAEGAAAANSGGPKAGVAVSGSGTIRIPAARLDALLLQIEELLAVKLSVSQRAEDVSEIRRTVQDWDKSARAVSDDLRLMRDYVEKTRSAQTSASEEQAALGRIVDYLAYSQSMLETLSVRTSGAAKASREDVRVLGRMVDNLLEDTKRILMLPVASLLETFPRMVREVCRDQGKESDFVVVGGDVEIDKRILERLKDPVTHLVRNCIDHGLESSLDRERAGKPRRGSVRIAVAQVESSKVEVVIQDDGRGINAGKVKRAAVKSGQLTEAEAEAMSDADALALIFRSGVSTSPIITDLSGRGLGLAIVSERVEELGGRVTVTTTPGQGTTFRILLPLTLATFRGIFVEAAGQTFVIPTAGVERVLRMAAKAVDTVENRETVVLDGKALSMVSLAGVLALPAPPGAEASSTDRVQAVVLSSGEQRIAFKVERILFEREVLVKSLGSQLNRVQNVAAATVLGSGRVVPILNVRDLMASAVGATGTRAAQTAVAEAGSKAGVKALKSILVVEDSITSRMLMKNILESAGYRVTTAVDGMDGFTALKSGKYDLVVSDIQMPRMTGLEMTERIRRDPAVSATPVILVTSLGSREDRERGVEAGANAYIMKSSFDQGNLLDMVRRLI